LKKRTIELPCKGTALKAKSTFVKFEDYSIGQMGHWSRSKGVLFFTCSSPSCAHYPSLTIFPRGVHFGRISNESQKSRTPKNQVYLMGWCVHGLETYQPDRKRERNSKDELHSMEIFFVNFNCLIIQKQVGDDTHIYIIKETYTSKKRPQKVRFLCC
jgi:hypothetical protein